MTCLVKAIYDSSSQKLLTISLHCLLLLVLFSVLSIFFIFSFSSPSFLLPPSASFSPFPVLCSNKIEYFYFIVETLLW